jgi:hypothetical protein
MTHEIRPDHDPAGEAQLRSFDEVTFSPADALRASPVVAPYETLRDGSRSAEADEYDSGQQMIAELQGGDYAEAYG